MDGRIGYSDLAHMVGIPHSTLKSILRYAMTYRCFAEKEPGYVEHTAVSRLLAMEPSIDDFTAFALDEIIMPDIHSGEALQKWPQSDASTETAFMLGEKSSALNYWSHLAHHPARLDRFVKVMALGLAAEFAFIADNFPWADVRTVVELGGSKGELATLLAEKYPHLAMTVQDLPHLIENDTPSFLEEKDAVQRRVILQAHDFFEEQPVKHADVYLCRHVFHNWSDTACIRILKALAPALKSGSRVLIIDAILPEPGTVSLSWERTIRWVHQSETRSMKFGADIRHQVH